MEGARNNLVLKQKISDNVLKKTQQDRDQIRNELEQEKKSYASKIQTLENALEKIKKEDKQKEDRIDEKFKRDTEKIKKENDRLKKEVERLKKEKDEKDTMIKSFRQENVASVRSADSLREEINKTLKPELMILRNENIELKKSLENEKTLRKKEKLEKDKIFEKQLEKLKKENKKAIQDKNNRSSEVNQAENRIEQLENEKQELLVRNESIQTELDRLNVVEKRNSQEIAALHLELDEERNKEPQIIEKVIEKEVKVQVPIYMAEHTQERMKTRIVEKLRADKNIDFSNVMKFYDIMSDAIKEEQNDTEVPNMNGFSGTDFHDASSFDNMNFDNGQNGTSYRGQFDMQNGRWNSASNSEENNNYQSRNKNNNEGLLKLDNNADNLMDDPNHDYQDNQNNYHEDYNHDSLFNTNRMPPGLSAFNPANNANTATEFELFRNNSGNTNSILNPVGAIGGERTSTNVSDKFSDPFQNSGNNNNNFTSIFESPFSNSNTSSLFQESVTLTDKNNLEKTMFEKNIEKSNIFDKDYNSIPSSMQNSINNSQQSPKSSNKNQAPYPSNILGQLLPNVQTLEKTGIMPSSSIFGSNSQKNGMAGSQQPHSMPTQHQTVQSKITGFPMNHSKQVIPEPVLPVTQQLDMNTGFNGLINDEINSISDSDVEKFRCASRTSSFSVNSSTKISLTKSYKNIETGSQKSSNSEKPEKTKKESIKKDNKTDKKPSKPSSLVPSNKSAAAPAKSNMASLMKQMSAPAGVQVSGSWKTVAKDNNSSTKFQKSTSVVQKSKLGSKSNRPTFMKDFTHLDERWFNLDYVFNNYKISECPNGKNCKYFKKEDRNSRYVCPFYHTDEDRRRKIDRPQNAKSQYYYRMEQKTFSKIL